MLVVFIGSSWDKKSQKLTENIFCFDECHNDVKTNDVGLVVLDYLRDEWNCGGGSYLTQMRRWYRVMVLPTIVTLDNDKMIRKSRYNDTSVDAFIKGLSGK